MSRGLFHLTDREVVCLFQCTMCFKIGPAERDLRGKDGLVLLWVGEDKLLALGMQELFL